MLDTATTTEVEQRPKLVRKAYSTIFDPAGMSEVEEQAGEGVLPNAVGRIQTQLGLHDWPWGPGPREEVYRSRSLSGGPPT